MARFALIFYVLLVATLWSNQCAANEADGFGGDEDFPMEEMDMEENLIDTPLQTVPTLKDLEEFVNPEDVLVGGGVVGIFASKEDPNLKEFESFAGPLDGNGFRFAISTGDQEMLDKFGVKDGWKIFVFPPPRYISEAHKDKPRYRFGGSDVSSDSGKTALKNFILKHSLPLVSRIAPLVGNERIFVERLLPVFVVISKFDEENDPKGTTYILNRVRKIGETYRDKMVFAIVDKEDAMSTVRFQIRFFVPDETEAAKTERIVGIKDGKNFYTMPGSFSVEAATQFIDDFFLQKLKPSSYQDEMVDVIDDENFGKVEL